MGGPPTDLSRAGAMMHAAMYDAAVSVTREGAPYLLKTPDLPDDGARPSLAERKIDGSDRDDPYLAELVPGA